MDSDDRFYIWVFAIIASTLVILIVGSTIVCTYHTRKMASLGYEEVERTGTSETLWQKSK